MDAKKEKENESDYEMDELCILLTSSALTITDLKKNNQDYEKEFKKFQEIMSHYHLALKGLSLNVKKKYMGEYQTYKEFVKKLTGFYENEKIKKMETMMKQIHSFDDDLLEIIFSTTSSISKVQESRKLK